MTQSSARCGLRVAVFVGTRADLGPLSPVISALQRADDTDLQILTGVEYDARELAEALPAECDWSPCIHPLAPAMADLSPTAITVHGAVLAAETPQVLRRLGSEVLVVLGDRWELLYVVPPAFLLGIPIVHLHGGEVTEGAIDERIRHAVSKLADQHCVASRDAADRLHHMGEPPDRVHHTGAPGLDRLAGVEPLTDEELGGLLGKRVQRPVALFTYHPPTAEPGVPVGTWAREALEATRRCCATVIATHPGMDAGREQVLAALTAAADDEDVVVVEALGAEYPRVLASVDVVVGNSSSGIIEAGAVHVPAVNIGERQRGRLRGAHVVEATEGFDSVAEAVQHALTPECEEVARTSENPYGSGNASERIVDVVRQAARVGRTKKFVDVDEGTG